MPGWPAPSNHRRCNRPRRVNADPDGSLARELIAAHAQGRCLSSDDYPIEPERAYRVQAHVVDHRLRRGEHIVGWKLGYTSAAMREQMGIDEPNLGPLSDRMILRIGDRLPDSVLQPRIEPEIALVLGRDSDGDHDAESVRGLVSSAHAALEIVDSVWCDYRFTWAQNTADGSSAAFVVLGDPLHVREPADVHVDLELNGVLVGEGRGADAMGNPYAALSWLNRQLLARGVRLRAGDVVMTGGLTPAVPFMPGDSVRARFDEAVVQIARDPIRHASAGDESL
jgi:2-keto-4-pentenoate hydratase